MGKAYTRKVFFALGTVNSITVFGQECTEALNQTKERVMELHRKWNAFDPDSEVSEINANASKRAVKVSADTFSIIERAVSYSGLTEGAFDITTGELSRLWKEAIDAEVLPNPQIIRGFVRERSYEAICLDQKRSTVYLFDKEQRIDLGGIAKGYAADEVKRILTENGICEAIIDLGGTVINIGTTRKIGLQVPFQPHGQPFATITIGDREAVVTSGLYEQYFRKDGRLYHHIIDQRTGYPSDAGLLGVTLIGDSAEKLDVLSTSIVLQGIEKGMKMRNDIEAVFITSNGEVIATNGLEGKLLMRKTYSGKERFEYEKNNTGFTAHYSVGSIRDRSGAVHYGIICT